jgi:GDP-fucose protein O-fucosyltransferase
VKHPTSQMMRLTFFFQLLYFEWLRRTRVSAQELYDISKDELTPGTTVYMATDERDKSFFKDLSVHYDIVYLDDFAPLLKGVNTNFYGMIDQLITSRSRVFFGCWFSTFTGYINRIRGKISWCL